MMATDGSLADTMRPAKRRRIFLQTMGQQLRESGLPSSQSGSGTMASSQSASGFVFIRSVYDGLTTDSPSQQQHIGQTPESDLVPGENDEQQPNADFIATVQNLWYPHEVTYDVEDQPYSFDNLIKWSQSYFDHWHPAYPFIHAPSMIEYFQDISQHGISGSSDTHALQMTILRTVMSISLADRRQFRHDLPPVPAILVHQSYGAAIREMGRALTSETTILSLQTTLGLVLFLISMLRYNAACRLQGLAVRMALQLGLHRCPAHSPQYNTKERELRKRLFWTMYCIDLHIATRLGIPMTLHLSDIDTCHVLAENHGEESAMKGKLSRPAALIGTDAKQLITTIA
jgi:hypothetical protein